MNKLYLICLSLLLCFLSSQSKAQQPPITFAFPTFINTSPQSPNGIATADFDMDGKADVVVTNRDTNFISTFKNTSTIASISFGPKSNLLLAGKPVDIITGDIDHDGKADIIVKTNQQNVISIFRNTSVAGAISFASRVDIPAITFANNDQYGRSMALGYLNADSLPEIVSTNSNFQTFSIFKNNSSPGTIAFASPSDVPCDSYPNAVLIQDFDGDGKQDLAIKSSGPFFDNFLNTGTGDTIRVQPAGTKITPGFITSMKAGDYDMDGKPDLVILSHAPRVLTIFRNTGSPGSISFSDSINFPFSRPPYFVDDADFNIDGKIDILPIGFSSPGVFPIYKNNSTPGNISFTMTDSTSMSASPRSCVIKDLNGDNKPDILAIDGGSIGVFVLRNTFGEPSIGSFSPATAAQGDTVTIKGMNLTGSTVVKFGAVAAASYSIVNDSTIVAVVGSGATGAVQVSTPEGVATKAGFVFAKPPSISYFSPVKGDSGTVVYIAGKGFIKTTTQITFGGIAAASVNVISDSVINAVVGAGASGDVAITTPGGTAAKPGFLFGPIPSVSSFTPQSGGANTTITITGKKLSATTFVRIGGIPAASFIIVNDTVLTVVVGAGATGFITISSDYGSYSVGEFFYTDIPVITSFAPLSDTAGATVTINGRHFNSIASNNKVFFGAVAATVLTSTDTSLSVKVPAGATYKPTRVTTNNMTGYSDMRFSIRFPGTPDSLTAAAFDNKISFATGAGATYMNGCDLNGDGKPDLLTINRTTGRVSIYKNISTYDSIAFATPFNLSTASNTTAIYIEDLNNDSKPDLVLTNSGFMVFRNQSTPGTFSFSLAVNTSTRRSPRGIAIRDMDYDGRPDIILEAGKDTIGLLRNFSSEGRIDFFSDLLLYNFDSIVSPNTGGIPSGGTFLEDINRDGLADICIASNSATHDSLFVFINASMPGKMKFGPRLSVTKGATGPAAVAAGDLDGDSIPDIAVANIATNNLAIIHNNSAGGNLQLDAAQLQATGQYPLSLAIGDIDGDGKPEITTGDSLSNTISIFRNKSTPGAMLFSNEITLPGGTSPRSLYVGDLNGDGKADIAALNFSKDSIVLFRNRINAQQATPLGTNLVTGAANPRSMLVFRPNPARNYVTVIHPVSNHPAELLLTDIKGRVIKRMTAGRSMSTTTLILPGVKQGLYMIRWTDGSNSLSKVLIVQ
jgi:hypothetical protein